MKCLGRLSAFGSLGLIVMLCWVSGAAAAIPPPNDDFANAVPLGGPLPIEADASNEGATRQQGEPEHAPMPSGGHTIWFRWEATSTEAVTISTCGSSMPTILGVYVGDGLGALNEVASNTWEAGGCSFAEGTQATFRAVSGKAYSIQIDGNTYHDSSAPSVSGEGAIKLQIRHQPPPANDDFTDAAPLQLDSLSAPAPNFGATKEPGEPSHRGDVGGASVWFKFTAPRTGGVWIQTNGGPVGRENVVAAYTGSSVGELTPVPMMDLFGSSRSAPAFPVTAGVTYYIALDGRYDPLTETAVMDEPEISLSTFPRNDDFEDAFSLPTGPMGGTSGLFGLGNVGATKQPAEPDHAGNRGGASVWFTWTAPGSGSAQLSACGATFDTLLAVYTGSRLDDLKPVAASRHPQSPACSLGTSSEPGEVSFNVDAGSIYKFAVDGYEGAWGGFGMELKTSTQRLRLDASQPVEEWPDGPGPPRTWIASRHLNPRRGIAIFHLRSSEPVFKFLCRLDGRPFSACRAKIVYRRLKHGHHTFASKAMNSSGEVDPTPVVFHFRIGRPRS